MDKLGELKGKLEELYNATEPPQREEEKEVDIEEEPEIEIEAKQEEDKIDIEIREPEKEKIKSKIEIDAKKLVRDILREKLDKAKGKIG